MYGVVVLYKRLFIWPRHTIHFRVFRFHIIGRFFYIMWANRLLQNMASYLIVFASINRLSGVGRRRKLGVAAKRDTP